MYDPAGGFPRVVPELVYQDVAAAMEWLASVFGFREILRHTVRGQVDHADMETGSGGVVMLAAAAQTRRSPAHDEHVCQKVIVFVDDVDQHFAAAQLAGAQPRHAPVDKPWGLRQYVVRDREGHLWEFSQHVRDVPAQHWGAVAAGEQGGRP